MTEEQPIAQQVATRLRQMIESGRWRPGDRLPAERELCDDLSTSRVSLRRALALLVGEGMVRRHDRARAEVLAAQPARPGLERDHLCVLTPIPFASVVDPTNDELINIIAAALHGASQAQLRFTYHHVDAERMADGVAVRALLRPYYGGVLLIGHDHLGSDALQGFASADCPVVAVQTSGAERCPGLHVVERDDGAGMRLALEHLRGLGHQRILHLTYRDALPWVRARATVLAAAGVPTSAPLAMRETTDRSLALARIQRVLDDGATAVIAVNDGLAELVLAAAAQQGRRVPEDLSVVGFDNVALAATLGLTTVAHMSRELGDAAMRLLLDAMAQRAPAQGRHLRIEPRLMVRRSTGRSGGG